MSSVAKRRINGNPIPSNNQYSSVESSPLPQSAGLTLPQVIALVDKRLIHLETNMVEKNNIPNEEFENRFEILAEEISNIKEIVLKLQSYTMSVNKMLLDEKNTTSKEEFHMDL